MSYDPLALLPPGASKAWALLESLKGRKADPSQGDAFDLPAATTAAGPRLVSTPPVATTTVAPPPVMPADGTSPAPPALRLPAPDVPPAPVLLPQTVDEQAGATDTPAARPRYVAPPLVTYDDRGRPRPGLYAPDDLASKEAYSQAVARYQPKNQGWARRILAPTVEGFARGGIGGALFGAFEGLARPKLADEMWKAQASRSAGADVAGELAKLREQAQTADVQSQTNQRNALAASYGTKSGAAALKQQQDAILGNLRLLKGQPLDPNNPAHAALIKGAQDAGIYVDPVSWNASAGNVVKIGIVDPDNPTQRRTQFYNKATGEATDAGQSGYVQPVDAATGMTAAQSGAQADRKAGLALRATGQQHLDQWREWQKSHQAAEFANKTAQQKAQLDRQDAQDAQRLFGQSATALRQGAPHVQKFEMYKQMLAQDPNNANARAKMNSEFEAIKAGYGSAYEAGTDAQGNPYVKPHDSVSISEAMRKGNLSRRQAVQMALDKGLVPVP
jgi:hypothetical protein